MSASVLEEEIKGGFSQLKLEDTKASRLLSKLELKPIETIIYAKCKVWTGDRRMKYHPMTIVKSLILKDLLCIRSYLSLTEHLDNNPDEAEDLGYGDLHLPSQQALLTIRKEKLDSEVMKMAAFVADKIRETAIEQGKHLDIDFAGKKVGTAQKSTRTFERHKSREGSKIVRMLKDEVFPLLDLPLTSKARYSKGDLLDLLAFAAYEDLCVNQGYKLMREDGKFEGRVPQARTLLGYLAKLSNVEIQDMFIAAFDRIVKIAKSRGMLQGEVDLAIDYTDWLYYGDRNDKMVVRGQCKNGTDKRFRYITVKVVGEHGDFTLCVLPVGAFTDHRDVLKRLILHAMSRVNVRNFYVDRGFYSAKYISVFDETGVKYLMPVPKNERIRKLIKNHPAPSIVDYEMETAGGKYHIKGRIVIRKDADGKDLCFITNIAPLLLHAIDPLELYKRRWNIETGYRVQKHEFRPNTSSKNWKIRMFYFMFSTLLYNLWVITNVMVSDYLFGEQVEYRLITAKLFMKKFYEAYRDART